LARRAASDRLANGAQKHRQYYTTRWAISKEVVDVADVPASRASEVVAHVSAGGGRTLNVLGDSVTLVVTGEETGGALMACEVTVTPGGGPPPHRHAPQEVMRVFEGEIEITRMREGKLEALVAAPGSLVYIPENAVHTYRNTGPKPARFLSILQPAGQERFFLEVSELASDPSGLPAAEEIAAVAAKHGISLLEP
jgi:oxalate decarboxylase/phosphoglucose isomerase-like protein (cupin superfamily)